MKVLAFSSLVLMCVLVAHGQNCVIHRAITSSLLRCEGEVYSRPQDAIDALNACYGRNYGSDISNDHLACIAEQVGISRNGIPMQDVIYSELQRAFPIHYHALAQGLNRCAELDRNNPFHPGCINQVYADVCKHRTCDWINTLD